jgi:hypothetical protein
MPYGNMSGGEDFVLGQTSAFGKDVAKEFKGSKRKDRQQALSTFMAQQGKKYRNEEKAINQAFESGSRLNNLMAGPYVAKATGGKYKGMKQPTGGATTSEIASMAKNNPTLFNAMLVGGIVQSPVKVAGRVVEAVTGDETAGNRLSQSVLDEITAPSNARFTGGVRGAMANMSEDERRITANKFYADQLKSNEEKAMAKEALGPDFTSDTTYGDVIDTAAWFSPGSFLKGLKIAGKAGSMGVKAASMAPRPARIAGGLAAGAGAYAGYNELQPDNAEAASLKSIFNLDAPVKVGGRMRTELDRIQKQVNKTTSRKQGSGKGLGKEDVREFLESWKYNPMNRAYIDAVESGELKLPNEDAFVVAYHKTGKPPELGGPRNPAGFMSGELNRLEVDMRKAGKLPRNSIDIMNWALENNPKYKGFTIADMIQRMGM